MEKRLIFILMIALALIGSGGCKSDTGRESERICGEIINLKNNYNNLPRVMTYYKSICDSVGKSNVGSLNKGIIDGLNSQNDTLQLIGRLLCNSPEEFGSWTSSKAVEEILNDKNIFDINQKIENRNSIIYFLYSTSDEPQNKIKFEKSFQAHIDSLNISTQALIYTKMIAPSTLGSYMRENLKDYSRQDSAKDLVMNIQKIYSKEPSKGEEFNKAYNTNY